MSVRDTAYTSQSHDATDRLAPQTKTLPVDTPPERLQILIVRYRDLLDDWDQDQFTHAYCMSVIAEAEDLLAGGEVSR